MKLERSGRVKLAIILWIVVGGFLVFRGMQYFGRIETTTGKVLAIGLALVLGAAKGWFVLSKSAVRTAGFIARRPERDWFWNAFHPMLWVLIPLMIVMGWGLRNFYGEKLPALVVAVYVGIGAAMIVGSRGFTRKPQPAKG